MNVNRRVRDLTGEMHSMSLNLAEEQGAIPCRLVINVEAAPDTKQGSDCRAGDHSVYY